jgi:hypothetical protein
MKMKKLLALLLALVMVFTLFACSNDSGKKDDDDDDKSSAATEDTRPLSEKIVGNWTGVVSMTGEMMEMPAFTGKLEMKLNLTMNADGTASISVDKTAYAASIEKNRQGLADAFVQMWIEAFGGRDAAEATIQQNYSMSMEEYAQVCVDEAKSSVPDMNEDSKWTLTGDKLNLGEEEDDITVSVEGNTMTWSGGSFAENMGADSITFTRN